MVKGAYKMIISRFVKFLSTGFALLTLSWGLFAYPGEPPKIYELTNTDKHYMSAQRASLDDLARIHLGRQFRNEKDADLALLQVLLDRQLVRANQKKELQAMGVIMGDFLADELKMHWIIYEDKVGRSRTLQYKDSEHFLFPMTMISRRQEVNNQTSVRDIYQRAVSVIKPKLPPAPYQ
ncbi:MAG: hypothetical protein ACJAZ0_002149 [Halioglobus sp.]|jgi:hypothetical protein